LLVLEMIFEMFIFIPIRLLAFLVYKRQIKWIRKNKVSPIAEIFERASYELLKYKETT